MKRILLMAGVLSLGLVSCGGSDAAADAQKALEDMQKDLNASKKGAWSAEDKKKAHDAVDKERASLEASFGEYTDVFIECYLGKAEANFDNFAAADGDLTTMQAYASECSTDITEKMLAEMGAEEEVEINE